MTMKNFAILFLDTQGVFIDCNTEAEELFGISRDQFQGMTPDKFSPETQPDGSSSKERAAGLIKAALDGTPQVFEWQQQRPDGSRFDTEVSLNRLDIGGKTLLLTIHKDITELKQAEAARLESELMFRSIVENSHAGVFTIDEDFIITYANDMVSLLLERPNDQIVGHNFREFLDAESEEEVVNRYMSRLQGQDVLPRYEFNVITASGEKRIVEINSSTIRDLSGNLKTVGQVLDVTERKKAEEEVRQARETLELRVEQRTAELRAANQNLQDEIVRRENTEQALRRSETKYRHLAEAGNTIILEIDTQGRAVSFNNFAQHFFGYSESEIVGKSIVGTIVPPHDSAGNNLQEMMDRILEHPEDYHLNENENIRKNGERVWIIWTNQPILDENGKLKEILCVGIDHTQKN